MLDQLETNPFIELPAELEQERLEVDALAGGADRDAHFEALAKWARKVEIFLEAGIPPSPLEICRKEIQEHLDCLPFKEGGALPDWRDHADFQSWREACIEWRRNMTPQLAQEAVHVQYAAEIMRYRKEQLGGAYEPGNVDMKTAFGEGAWRAALEFVLGALSSMSRTPVANAVLTDLQPENKTGGQIGELDDDYDLQWRAGGVAGASAYGMSFFTEAARHQAKIGNMPELHAVKVECLYPDPPAVKLKVSGHGEAKVKEYARLNVVEQAAERKKAEETRDRKKTRQANLKGGGIFLPLLPSLLAMPAGVMRRRFTPIGQLTNPGVVLGTSLITSALTGGIPKALYGGLLPTLPGGWAQAEVDNLVGGIQKVPLYSMKRLRPDLPIPGILDIGRGLMNTARDAAAMVGTSIDPFHGVSFWSSFNQLTDVARHLLNAASAAEISAGMGVMASSLDRNQFDPLPNESPRSPGNYLTAAGRGFAGDSSWTGLQKGSEQASYNILAETNRRRETRMAERILQFKNLCLSTEEDVRLLVESPLPDRWITALEQLQSDLLNFSKQGKENFSSTLERLNAAVTIIRNMPEYLTPAQEGLRQGIFMKLCESRRLREAIAAIDKQIHGVAAAE